MLLIYMLLSKITFTLKQNSKVESFARSDISASYLLLLCNELN